MKVAKIIATSFAKRNFRTKTYLLGSPLGFFGHSQTFGSPQDILNLIKFNISIEKKIDPGVDKRDLIIINNDIGYKKGNTFLKKYQVKKFHLEKSSHAIEKIRE